MTKVLEKVPRVDNSPKSPCWQQRQIAAQQSFLETAKAGKEVVRAAACKDEPQKKAAS